MAKPAAGTRVEFAGKMVSPIGIGTWHIGGGQDADRSDDDAGVAAIRLGLGRGMNLVDTAEMYGAGHTEELVGRAIAGIDREELCIISKVWHNHLRRRDVLSSAKASLSRLGLKYMDLYLVHWPNPEIDIKETIGAMEELVDLGIVRHIGVSNFGVAELEGAMAACRKYEIEANEIKYSLAEKGCERDIIPFCEKNGIRVIAYTPLAKGSVGGIKAVAEVAVEEGRTPVQVALNYLMRRSIPIPKASSGRHWDEIAGAMDWRMDDAHYARLAAM